MMLDKAQVKKTPGAIDVTQITREYQGAADFSRGATDLSRGGDSVAFVVIVVVALGRTVGAEEDVWAQIIHFSIVAFVEFTTQPRMANGGFGQMKLGRAAAEEELTNGATEVIHAADIQSVMMVKTSWRKMENAAVFVRLLSFARKLLRFLIIGISMIQLRRLRVADEKSRWRTR